MKKIMFNDRYGLTEAVLDGRKTQTRRIAYEKPFKHIRSCGFCTEGKDKGKLAIYDGNEIVAKSTYKIGEFVAVAQRYSDIPFNNKMPGLSIGWLNKMFVKSSLMPHQIKITDIRCERLHYISTDDCMKEGIFCSHIDGIDDAYSYDATNDDFTKKWWYRTPIEAYKMLSCKLHLHWDNNPLVFVYDFKLVK
ncbi:hypothetical protein [Segatella sp.]|uniref:hypothetical protein n=1 Tax=Segatella sp. TaxID=2974253 RepID=UPI0030797986